MEEHEFQDEDDLRNEIEKLRKSLIEKSDEKSGEVKKKNVNVEKHQAEELGGVEMVRVNDSETEKESSHDAMNERMENIDSARQEEGADRSNDSKEEAEVYSLISVCLRES